MFDSHDRSTFAAVTKLYWYIAARCWILRNQCFELSQWAEKNVLDVFISGPCIGTGLNRMEKILK